MVRSGYTGMVERACEETQRTREVSILPPHASLQCAQVMLTPTVVVPGNWGRLEAKRLMRDLYSASQLRVIGARSLLILHFDRSHG